VNNQNFMQKANQLGIFFVIIFVGCFVWYYIRPADQDLHLRLFRLAFFGYQDMGVMSFILGAVQSYIWGYIGVGLWLISGGLMGRNR